MPQQHDIQCSGLVSSTVNIASLALDVDLQLPTEPLQSLVINTANLSISPSLVGSLAVSYVSLASPAGFLNQSEPALVIPLSSLPLLRPDEVVGRFADIRKVLFAVCDAAAEGYAAIPREDRPATLSVSRASSDFGGILRRNYTFRFIARPLRTEVAPE
jgi:hypothetical protein